MHPCPPIAMADATPCAPPLGEMTWCPDDTELSRLAAEWSTRLLVLGQTYKSFSLFH